MKKRYGKRTSAHRYCRAAIQNQPLRYPTAATKQIDDTSKPIAMVKIKNCTGRRTAAIASGPLAMIFRFLRWSSIRGVLMTEVPICGLSPAAQQRISGTDWVVVQRTHYTYPCPFEVKWGLETNFPLFSRAFPKEFGSWLGAGMLAGNQCMPNRRARISA